MGLPAFLAQNFFDDLAFPDHTVSAEEEATGAEVERVADWRRSGYGASRWTPTTANSSTWVKVDCGAAKAADTIIIDRGHNIGGETITLETSANDSDWTQVFQITAPSSASDNTSLTTAAGVYTEEGAIIKTFTSSSARYWRFTISAMGAGEKPELYGVWLATRIAPTHNTIAPWDDDRKTFNASERLTPAGGMARGTAATPRTGDIGIRMASVSEYDDTFRPHIMDHYAVGRPMWIIPDDEYAERAFLAVVPAGREVGFGFEGNNWPWRTVRIPYVELAPALP